MWSCRAGRLRASRSPSPKNDAKAGDRWLGDRDPTAPSLEVSRPRAAIDGTSPHRDRCERETQVGGESLPGMLQVMPARRAHGQPRRILQALSERHRSAQPRPLAMRTRRFPPQLFTGPLDNRPQWRPDRRVALVSSARYLEDQTGGSEPAPGDSVTRRCAIDPGARSNWVDVFPPREIGLRRGPTDSRRKSPRT